MKYAAIRSDCNRKNDDTIKKNEYGIEKPGSERPDMLAAEYFYDDF